MQFKKINVISGDIYSIRLLYSNPVKAYNVNRRNSVNAYNVNSQNLKNILL